MTQAKITVDSRYNPQKFSALANHPALVEIENLGCDDGEFFIHLKNEYKFAPNPRGLEGLAIVSSIKEAREWLSTAQQVSA